MELEHYPGMIEKALEAIVTETKGRWDIYGVRAILEDGRHTERRAMGGSARFG